MPQVPSTGKADPIPEECLAPAPRSQPTWLEDIKLSEQSNRFPECCSLCIQLSCHSGQCMVALPLPHHRKEVRSTGALQTSCTAPAAMSRAHNSGHLKGTSRFTNTRKPRNVVLRQKGNTATKSLLPQQRYY